MNIADIKLLPVSSPICQALIQEQLAIQKQTQLINLIANCKEVLVVRLGGRLIAYGTFDLYEGRMIQINSLHFRDVFQHHVLGQYWLSRYLKRELSKKYYLSFSLAS